MHLDSITDGLELGDYVSEGQQIGTLGQSGKGMVDAYMAHLHYELFINGQNIDPTIDAHSLIDPQQYVQEPIGIDGGVLSPVLIIGERPQLSNIKSRATKL